MVEMTKYQTKDGRRNKMFEKVNPMHPDKVADRIAGAIVDYAYASVSNPKIAVEVLIGHGHATVIVESSYHIARDTIKNIVWRLAKIETVKYIAVSQDEHLANNQAGKFRCGDNGIFKGVPLTKEEIGLTAIAGDIYKECPYDGKYIYDESSNKFIICQSNAKNSDLHLSFPEARINPLGEWTGGTDVDSGATNRKLGSDMGNSVTGGGLHGKDLSKADVSVNIYAFLKAQTTGKVVELSCAIGDEFIDGKPYGEIVAIAREYIRAIGGFEKFAEWGLIRPGEFYNLDSIK